MSKVKSMFVAAALAGAVFAPAMAEAAVSYSYVASFDGGSSFGSSISATAGQTLTANIYLKETLTAGSSSLLVSEAGLVGYGFSVNLVSGSSSMTGVANNAAIFGGPVAYDVSNSTSHRGATGAIAPAVVNGPTPDANGLILLGTVTFNVSSGSSNFVLGVHDTTFYGNTLTNTNYYDLDVSDAGYTGAESSPFNFTISTATVPEPASIGILAIAGAGLIARRRR